MGRQKLYHGPCKLESCDKPAKTKGYCRNHYVKFIYFPQNKDKAKARKLKKKEREEKLQQEKVNVRLIQSEELSNKIPTVDKQTIETILKNLPDGSSKQFEELLRTWLMQRLKHESYVSRVLSRVEKLLCLTPYHLTTDGKYLEKLENRLAEYRLNNLAKELTESRHPKDKQYSILDFLNNEDDDET